MAYYQLKYPIHPKVPSTLPFSMLKYALLFRIAFLFIPLH